MLTLCFALESGSIVHIALHGTATPFEARPLSFAARTSEIEAAIGYGLPE